MSPDSKMSADEQRKLAAIMFTDMVGYSALSQRDEKLPRNCWKNIDSYSARSSTAPRPRRSAARSFIKMFC